jgi:hypothetical protein
MKKNQIATLFAISFLCCGLLLSLYALSPLTEEIYRGSFIRKINARAVETKHLELGLNSYYIAGYNHKKIYLGNLTAPLHVLISNMNLTDSQHVNIKLKTNIDSILEPKRFRLFIDSTTFYLTHGPSAVFLKGNVSTWEANRFLESKKTPFIENVPIGPTTLILRSYSPYNKSYEIGKKTKSKPFAFNPEILQKQIDGLFCVDGKLHYAKETNNLVYVHFYRNELILADTNLNLEKRTHTIDSFSHAKLKISKIKDDNTRMLSEPPAKINGPSCIYKNHIYIQSNIMSRNESEKTFLEQSIVDAYDTKTGEYSRSLYIPSFKNEKMNEFQIIDKKIIALYTDHIVEYKLIDY